jgi:hypothetical protein
MRRTGAGVSLGGPRATRLRLPEPSAVAALGGCLGHPVTLPSREASQASKRGAFPSRAVKPSLFHGRAARRGMAEASHARRGNPATQNGQLDRAPSPVRHVAEVQTKRCTF